MSLFSSVVPPPPHPGTPIPSAWVMCRLTHSQITVPLLLQSGPPFTKIPGDLPVYPAYLKIFTIWVQFMNSTFLVFSFFPEILCCSNSNRTFFRFIFLTFSSRVHFPSECFPRRSLHSAFPLALQQGLSTMGLLTLDCVILRHVGSPVYTPWDAQQQALKPCDFISSLVLQS